MLFLPSSQLLVGASVQTYLLEKTRVAGQPINERNFHIFYQVSYGRCRRRVICNGDAEGSLCSR